MKFRTLLACVAVVLAGTLSSCDEVTKAVDPVNKPDTLANSKGSLEVDTAGTGEFGDTTTGRDRDTTAGVGDTAKSDTTGKIGGVVKSDTSSKGRDTTKADTSKSGIDTTKADTARSQRDTTILETTEATLKALWMAIDSSESSTGEMEISKLYLDLRSEEAKSYIQIPGTNLLNEQKFGAWWLQNGLLYVAMESNGLPVRVYGDSLLFGLDLKMWKVEALPDMKIVPDTDTLEVADSTWEEDSTVLDDTVSVDPMACGGSVIDPALVGGWSLVGTDPSSDEPLNGGMTFDLRQDGTATLTMQVPGEPDDSYEMGWSADNGLMTFLDPSSGDCETGEIMEYGVADGVLRLNAGGQILLFEKR